MPCVQWSTLLLAVRSVLIVPDRARAEARSDTVPPGPGSVHEARPDTEAPGPGPVHKPHRHLALSTHTMPHFPSSWESDAICLDPPAIPSSGRRFPAIPRRIWVGVSLALCVELAVDIGGGDQSRDLL
jgi:hypothetical protein